MLKIDRMIIKGYKSIENCDIALHDINVIIGANGAGKSNFISVFKMLGSIYDKNLQRFVSKNGGPDSLLHFGRKKTKSIEVLVLADERYEFKLSPTADNRMMFEEEISYWGETNQLMHEESKAGHFESLINFKKENMPGVYHFHDTSETAYVKGLNEINDNFFLKSDASNLAAFLYRLKATQAPSYERIIKTIRMAAPFFNDFVLRPTPLNQNKIELEWYEVGCDIPFKAMHLSDGTLRFICLATALLQPEDLQPNIILIDEPELGLHPYAITILASLIKSVSKRERQVIISTQSIDLLNEFDVDDVIVADRESNSSVFKRLDENHLKLWLCKHFSQWIHRLECLAQ